MNRYVEMKPSFPPTRESIESPSWAPARVEGTMGTPSGKRS
jgi:hypothetical protein